MKRFQTNLFFTILCLFSIAQESLAQCYPDKVVTATMATGGTSLYKNEVLWLTWGSTDEATNPHGKAGQTITDNTTSYASILLDNGDYLCVKAMITNITGASIKSYTPGDYTGDSMDNLYNIGGTGVNNQLVNGIITSGITNFTVVCGATLNGNPVKLVGAVVGDAESLNGNGEYIKATADGTWTITEMKKNNGAGVYNVSKTNSGQTINFLKGNDNNTAAVTFLTFDDTAYANETNGYEVSFTVEMSGTGKTALGLGLLLPTAERGDAPVSYGNPVHRLNGIMFSDDGVPTDGTVVNLNDASYSPAGLISGSNGYLGSVGPDTENTQAYSKDAKGDDSAGLPNEENAWPILRISKASYAPTQSISAIISYMSVEDAWISGWIDFNLNGIFDVTEKATQEALAGNSSVTLTWTVPDERVLKNTYVRLRYAENKSDVLSPTGIVVGGEVEDFWISIEQFIISNPVLRSRAINK